MSESKGRARASLAGDMLALVPGWALVAAIDPCVATAVGIPIAALAIAVRRLLWEGPVARGRAAIAVVYPVVVPSVAAALVLGSGGPALGLLLAAAVLAVAEGWSRRSGVSFARRSPLIATACFAVMGASFTALLLGAGLTRYPTEDFVEALNEPPPPPRWSPEARRQALEAVDSAIAEQDLDDAGIDRLYWNLAPGSADLLSAAAPHGVWVTLYERSGYRERGFSSGGSDALDDVLRAARAAAGERPRKPRSSKTRPRLWHDERIGAHGAIDVPGATQRIHARPVFSLLEPLFPRAHRSLRGLKPIGRLLDMAYEVEIGVDGLELSEPSTGRVAVVLPSEPITEGWLTPRVRSGPAKVRAVLDHAWRRDTGERFPFGSGSVEVRKLRTSCFGRPRAGAEVVEWYRGNVLLEGEPDRRLLVERTAMAADWLARRIGDGGRFEYEIFPPYRKSSRDYSLPRHAGAVYGLLAAYGASRREPTFGPAGERSLAAALSSLRYVAERLGPPDSEEGEGAMCFAGSRGGAESGSTALALMAVCEIPEAADIEDPDPRERIEALPVDRWIAGMGACLLGMIDPDGAVFRTYGEARSRDRVEKEPLYFPGEVALALVRAHGRSGDGRLLEGARRICDRQIGLYEWPLALDFPMPGDHWMIQALAELAERTGEERYAELAALMGLGYAREQYPPQAYLHPDYRGAYRRVADLPRTTRAASRGEALGAALGAARMLGRDTRDFEEALIAGARHLMEQQLTVENSHFVPEGWDVEGAIRMGLADNHCRIDNNQHAIVGMLAALEAMDLRDGRGR